MPIIRRQFSYHSSDFCGDEYKIRFCKNFTFPPPPNRFYLETMYQSYKKQLWGLALW